MANPGVLNEQGYPCGQFGFTPMTEAEEKATKDSMKDNEKKESDNK